MLRLRLIVVCVGLISIALFATTMDAQLRVALKVSADDVDLRNRMESAIRSDLRRIQGFEVVVDGPREFEVKALGIGTATDFAIGFTSVEVGVGYVESQGDAAVGVRVLCDAYIISGAGADNMREGSASFAASFDIHCAEPRRLAEKKKLSSREKR